MKEILNVLGQHRSVLWYFGCLSLGIWSAALNGDLGRVKYLIQKAVDPSQPDLAGYTALVSWEELGVSLLPEGD